MELNFYDFIVSSTSSTVIGILLPIYCDPVSVTKTSSSNLIPPKSMYSSNNACETECPNGIGIDFIAKLNREYLCASFSEAE
ncbi:MAG: hypothetical protein GQ564_07895 [Bacteroidales bacterium]|nr:hypothetical protein [Bacteroidales bacterium]